jgi:hypothetical protein
MQQKQQLKLSKVADWAHLTNVLYHVTFTTACLTPMGDLQLTVV